MLSSPRSAASLLTLLLVLAGVLAACGGGEGPGDAAEGDGGGGQEQQQQSEKQAQETKIAVGDVVSVDTERRRMVLRPTQAVDGQEEFSFNVRKTARITLGGREAEMSDVAEGQQAQVEYVTKNDVDRAISIQLFETGGQSGGEDTSN